MVSLTVLEAAWDITEIRQSQRDLSLESVLNASDLLRGPRGKCKAGTGFGGRRGTTLGVEPQSIPGAENRLLCLSYEILS